MWKGITVFEHYLSVMFIFVYRAKYLRKLPSTTTPPLSSHFHSFPAAPSPRAAYLSRLYGWKRPARPPSDAGSSFRWPPKTFCTAVLVAPSASLLAATKTIPVLSRARRAHPREEQKHFDNAVLEACLTNFVSNGECAPERPTTVEDIKNCCLLPIVHDNKLNTNYHGWQSALSAAFVCDNYHQNASSMASASGSFAKWHSSSAPGNDLWHWPTLWQALGKSIAGFYGASKKDLGLWFFSSAKFEVVDKGYIVLESFALPCPPWSCCCASLDWLDLEGSFRCRFMIYSRSCWKRFITKRFMEPLQAEDGHHFWNLVFIQINNGKWLAAEAHIRCLLFINEAAADALHGQR